jgi:hypothetical protein
MPGAWETEAEWRRLKRELDAWRVRRMRADALGQHRSQLDAAYTLVDRVLAELRLAMSTMAAAGGLAAEQARVHDRRLAWLRRLWDFFRERFDQRDDPALGAVLAGADEVVWSCHREPFAALAAMAGAESGPPPLPYVEPSLTPEVFPHGLVPGALRRDIDAPFLRRALEQLPFAVVRVPASCVTAPWWLVHLGHEVGHVVDARLLGYTERAAMVQALALDAAATDDWTQWSGETFADLYGALMHGQWALWALATAEAHDATAMVARRDSYPPPVVRLLVMAHACRMLDAPLAELDADITAWRVLAEGDPALAANVRAGQRVVEAMLGHEVRRTRWPTLAAWDASQWGRQALGAWTETLRKRPTTLTARPRRSWARALVAASGVRRKDGEAAAAAFDGESMAEDLLAWLPAVREPGSRAGAADVITIAGAQAVLLARDLMDAEPLR